MTHLAQQTGVSVAVVSRLLRGDATLRISETRRRQILETKERLGGVKTRRVRKKANLTHTIVTPVNRLFPPAVLQMMLAQSEFHRSFEEALRSRGFRLHLSLFEPEHPADAYEPLIQSHGCDGLLLLSGICNQQLADLLRQHHFPHVSNDFYAEQFQVNTVRAHTSDGMRQAVEHLMELGHRRIGFLGPRDSYRYPLAVAAMVARGLSLDERMNCPVDKIGAAESPERWRHNARQAFSNWLDRRPAATALICAYDLMAMGAIDVMRERNLVPGQDLSLVGHDNLEQRGSLRTTEVPILTTVDNPLDLVGRRSAELLLNQVLRGQTQIVHEQVPASLVVRQSSGRCPATTGA